MFFWGSIKKQNMENVAYPILTQKKPSKGYKLILRLYFTKTSEQFSGAILCTRLFRQNYQAGVDSLKSL